MEKLIFDRTPENVRIIKELSRLSYKDMTSTQKQSWIDNMKRGCYTYVDLNRVENTVAYLDKKIEDVGLKCEVKTKIWTKDDIPTHKDMERYVNNIVNIRKLNIVLSDTPNAPKRVELDYLEANNIEKILNDCNLLLENSAQQYLCSGEVFCGETSY